jgi:hypothetical protein
MKITARGSALFRLSPAWPQRAPRLRAARFAALLLVALGAAACDDPFELRWEARPDTALLYSLALPQTNLHSAFNFFFRTPLVVESPGATGQWDVALDTEADRLVLLPPGALGINSRARIAALPGVTFTEVREAPADTAAYVSNRSVPVAFGTVYVVQTGEQVGAFGQRCVFYAKLEPIEIDAVAGTLSFLFDASPACNDPRLVPPDR